VVLQVHLALQEVVEVQVLQVPLEQVAQVEQLVHQV
jgi:hypothetical protein